MFAIPLNFCFVTSTTTSTSTSTMAHLYRSIEVHSEYRDHKAKLSELEIKKALDNSTTIYIGNLSFYTSEEQIYELFQKCGEIKRIVMGLDKFKKTPCGFCFVE